MNGAERYMITDDGTLFDKITEMNYDSFEEIVMFMNRYENTLEEYFDENEELKSTNMGYEDTLGRLEEENKELKQTETKLLDMIDEMSLKYVYSMTDEPSKVNVFCNTIMNDFNKIKRTINPDLDWKEDKKKLMEKVRKLKEM